MIPNFLFFIVFLLFYLRLWRWVFYESVILAEKQVDTGWVHKFTLVLFNFRIHLVLHRPHTKHLLRRLIGAKFFWLFVIFLF